MEWSTARIPDAVLFWNPGAIGYLSELILAVVLAGYLIMRAARDWRRRALDVPTLLLTILMVALALLFLTSMLRVLAAGGWVSYAMPWSPLRSPATLAMPWSRPFGGVATAALILLAYQFPKPLANAQVEMRLAATGLALLILVETAIAVRADLAIQARELWWRPQWFAGWMTLGTIWAASLFWRQIASAAPVRPSDAITIRVTARIAMLWRRAPNREARVARAFLFLTLLPIIHTMTLFVPDEGQFERYPIDILICWSGLVQLVGLALVLIGYLPERSSFLFKLAIIGLAVLLAAVNGVAWMVMPAYEAQFRSPGMPSSGKALLFAPRGGKLGYAVQPTVFLPERVKGVEMRAAAAHIALPFDFPFYGRSYDRIFIDRRGTIGFARPPHPIDAAFESGRQPAIYPLLVDTPERGTDITIFANSERMVVTRRDRCGSNAPDRCYQVQTNLHSDGRIDIQYLDIPPAPRFALFSPIGAPWLVGITPGNDARAGPPLIQDHYRAFLAYLDRLFAPLVAFTIATALAAVIGLPLVFRSLLVAPLDRLLHGIRRFRAGELDAQVPVSFNDEIGYLIESFNQLTREQTAMTRGLEDRVADRVAEVADMTVRSTKLEERARLSADLHDAIAQTLASASLHANALPAQLRDVAGANVEAAERVARLNRHALNEIRLLLTELRDESEQFSFTQKLNGLMNNFSQLHGLTIACDLADTGPLPPEVFAIFYRVAQECLNNVVKHSGVRDVELSFDSVGDRAMLMVSDQGRGFDTSSVDRRERLGLSIMRDRAQTIGATLEIESAPGQGCRVTMIWIRE